MQDSRVPEYVLLWNKSDVVGMGRILFEPGTFQPSRIMHGRELQKHAKKGEVLVAVHNVLIFAEFQQTPYPYWFDGIESPPQTLGELNRAYFRGIIAWDLRYTVRNPRPSLGILGEHPRAVSSAVIDSFRDLVRRDSRRVSFGTVSVRTFTPERSPVSEAPSRQDSEGSSLKQSSRWADWQCSSYRLRMRLKSMLEQRSAVLGKRRRDDSLDGALLEGGEEAESERGGTGGRAVRRRTSFTGTDGANSQLVNSSNNSNEPRRSDSNSGAVVVDFDITHPQFASGANSEEPLEAPHCQLAEMNNPGRDTSSGMAEGSGKVNLGLADLKIKKRKYNYHSRRRASPKKISAYRRKCLELIEKAMTSNPFLEQRDCCSMYCFDNVNPEYARSQYIRFLDMKRPGRKRALSGMLDKTVERFRFDGRVVCSRFMYNGLTFSYSLQTSVKDTPLASSSSSVMACPREVRRDTLKDTIILFLRRFAAACGDDMPNRSYTNLPSMNKTQVFEKLLEELRAVQAVNAPSRSYFFQVWKEFCSQIKTHRYHGFAVCEECEEFRSLMNMNIGNEEAQEVIRRDKKNHFMQMKEERLGYSERKDLAIKYPSKYCSIIVDGADQRSYGLPHFIFETKQDKGHKLKVKIVGVLEHGMQKSLSLFTMTEEFETGANHIIEAVHRVLQEKKTKLGRLPETLFVQADNCTRENKNRYFMSYFEMLVARGVFVEVQVSFLPIGHTHADVDQCFSVVARRLRMVDTVTMNELMAELGNCYTPRARVSQMSKIANYSGLCSAESCPNIVPAFSYYRYFRFRRHSSSLAAESHNAGNGGASFHWFRTTCDVKYQHREEWCPLDNTSIRKGFLRQVPDLSRAPPIKTRPPPNVQEINNCLRSHERRINSIEKLNELRNLRDVVYTSRVIPMPWNVGESFEGKGDYLNGPPDQIEETVQHSANVNTGSQVPYTLNYFLAVITDEDTPEPFWIARTLQVERTDDEGNITMLKVRWYQVKSGSTCPYSASYEISTYISNDMRVVFDDTLDVRTIVCEFESLTRSGGLHVRTQKAIRQALNQN